MKKEPMTKKEYRRHLITTSGLLVLSILLGFTGMILEGLNAGNEIAISFVILMFLSLFFTFFLSFSNMMRAEEYERSVRMKKIDDASATIIECFDANELKERLIKNKFIEKDDHFYRSKYSFFRDRVKYYVRFSKSQDLEADLEELDAKLDKKHHFTFSQCNILIIGMEQVAEEELGILKEYTKKYKIPEEMMARLSTFNGAVCFLADEGCEKLYYVKPERTSISIYAHGVRMIESFYKSKK